MMTVDERLDRLETILTRLEAILNEPSPVHVQNPTLHVKLFCEERLTAAQVLMPKRAVLIAYQAWCEERGFAAVSDNMFGRELKHNFPGLITTNLGYGVDFKIERVETPGS